MITLATSDQTKNIRDSRNMGIITLFVFLVVPAVELVNESFPITKNFSPIAISNTESILNANIDRSIDYTNTLYVKPLPLQQRLPTAARPPIVREGLSKKLNEEIYLLKPKR